MTKPVGRPHRKPGRKPAPFVDAQALNVLVGIMEGRTLRDVVTDEDTPTRMVVYQWLATNPVFYDAYARARVAQQEGFADEILDIADDTSLDYIDRERQDGSVERVLDPEAVARSKVRIDARKWIMSKLAPRWADKVDVHVSGSLDVSNLTDAELEAKARQALTAMGVALPDGPVILGLPSAGDEPADEDVEADE